MFILQTITDNRVETYEEIGVEFRIIKKKFCGAKFFETHLNAFSSVNLLDSNDDIKEGVEKIYALFQSGDRVIPLFSHSQYMVYNEKGRRLMKISDDYQHLPV